MNEMHKKDYVYYGVINALNLDVEKILSGIPERDRERVRNQIIRFKQDSDYARDLIFNENQLQDIAYMHAQNACIFQQSVRLAAEMSLRLNKPFSNIFAEALYQNIFEQFIREFTLEMQNNPNVSLRITASRIMDSLIERNIR